MKVRRGPLLKIYLRLARAGLHWEKLWPRLWPAVGLSGLFLTLAFFDVLPLLPPWLHAAIVVAFLIAIAAVLQKTLTRLDSIGDVRARHRIELDSGLDHRPLTALDDELAAGTHDPAAIALWRAHKERVAARTRDLHLKLPHAGLAKRDPWAFRAGIALVLLIGAVAAGDRGWERLNRALIPPLSVTGLDRGVSYDVWITPPAYTREAPIYLGTNEAHTPVGGDPNQESVERILRVPVGSTLLAQVAGGGAIPSLFIDERETELNRVDADAYHLETTLSDGNRLAIEQKGRELASWKIAVVSDLAPRIGFTGAPETGDQQRLRLPFEATDDYGLQSVTAVLRRLDGTKIPGGNDEIMLRLPFPGEGATEAKAKSAHDLVGHVWAGLPVLIHLVATDQNGNIGVSSVEPAVLPERRFIHPVAKELVDIRKRLTESRRDRLLAALKIDNVTDAPDRFQENTTVFLALRIARSRLMGEGGGEVVAGVQGMLWDAALQLEEGLSAVASRDLREAQKALMEALQNNAELEELERLMDEVQEAMDRFMEALRQQMEQLGQMQTTDPNAQVMNNEDLQRMLDRARELMRQGSREAAEQMMAELQKMLENLRSALAQQGQMNQDAQRAQKSMKELQDIIRRQQELLDDTFQRAERGEMAEPQEGQTGQPGQDEQGDIRRQLGQLMQEFGEMMGQIPDAFGRAERSMRESEQALGQGQPSQAVGPQSEALEALRQGAQSAAQGLAQRMGRGNRFGRAGPGPFPGGPQLRGMRPGNRDPFGRPAEEDGSTGTATGNVEIPAESEIQRAREILEELRRRAGDLWRPEIELDYIERLLKRF